MPHEQKILIANFAGNEKLSGGEKQMLKSVEKLQAQGFQFFLLSDSENLLKEFAKRGWFSRGFWLGYGNQILFLILYIFSLLSAVYALIYFKVKYRIRKLYCLGLPDKIILTPIAKLLGYQVFWQEATSIKNIVAQPVYLFFYKFMARFAMIIASFEYIRRELVGLDAINTNNCLKTICPGVDLESYKKQTDIFDAMTSRNLLFDEKANFKIGCISDLENNFGVEYLVKAVSILNGKGENINLTIVGDGRQRENLQWLARELNIENKIKIIGYDGNFLNWILGFDVFVLSAVVDFSLINLIEAMACEKPVIAPAVDGVFEIIEPDKSGLVVEPGNAMALADAILKIMSAPARAKSMAKAGQERIEKDFSLERMVRELEKVFS